MEEQVAGYGDHTGGWRLGFADASVEDELHLEKDPGHFSGAAQTARQVIIQRRGRRGGRSSAASSPTRSAR